MSKNPQLGPGRECDLITGREFDAEIEKLKAQQTETEKRLEYVYRTISAQVGEIEEMQADIAEMRTELHQHIEYMTGLIVRADDGPVPSLCERIKRFFRGTK